MTDLQQYVLDLPLPNTAFFALVEATAALVDCSEKYWQSKGINGARIRILVEIMKNGGCIFPSNLAERIGVTKANISLLLVPLEQDGLIRRARHAEDGRKTIITITDTGKQLLSEHLPGNRETVGQQMSRLNELELQQLLTLLSKLRRG